MNIEEVKQSHIKSIDFADVCWDQLTKLARLRIEAATDMEEDDEDPLATLSCHMEEGDDRVLEWAKETHAALKKIAVSHGHADAVPDLPDEDNTGVVLQDLCINILFAIISQTVQLSSTGERLMQHFPEEVSGIAGQAIQRTLAKVLGKEIEVRTEFLTKEQAEAMRQDPFEDVPELEDGEKLLMPKQEGGVGPVEVTRKKGDDL